ncbi:MAG TPA: FAD-dependent oxidoreductase [Candidatus Saccharimonadia bacterium]|nr:FAD-dependent oxidoreductase [Candidatus Saccharimonadia bacterium]
MTTSKSSPTKIVIIGAGFGGLRAAEQLASRKDLQVTLISSEDTFTYYPRLYKTATGGNRAQSSIPVADILQGKPVTFVQDTMTKLDPEQKIVTGSTGSTYPYDQLVLAMGGITNYFGIPGLKEFSFGIKTIAGAEGFKHHLHQQLIDNKESEKDYVIIGGGPTGVELAASLSTYLKQVTKQHGLAYAKYRISVVEAVPRLLPRSPEAMAVKVKARLESLGINVMTGAVVKSQTADALQLESQVIATKTVVWTAGVANNPFFKDNPEMFTLAKNGKVMVDEHLQGRPGIYVIGDNAANPYSGLAQVAIADANFVVQDIMNVQDNKKRSVYLQKAPTPVVPVGDGWSAAQIGSLNLYGMTGHVLRLLGDLVGFHDIAPTSLALRSWMGEFSHEDSCPICTHNSVAVTPATD